MEKTFSDYDIQIPRGATSGNVAAICPKCSHDRKKKSIKCLSVDVGKGIWNCHHCGWKGSLKKREYALPQWENKTEITDPKIVEWFVKRNISQVVLKEMKVTNGVQFMPQTQKEEPVIEFNYFRSGTLTNVKYRTPTKDFKMVKDAELIFYNIDALKDQKEIYIVEGEIDCLTFLSAGVKNVVSVPNGASKKNNNLEYLDRCIDYFENIEKIYICTDNDEAGDVLADELARRLGLERCYRCRPGSYKDANEQYCKEGKLDFDAKAYPIENIVLQSEIEGLIDFMKHGPPKGWSLRGTIGTMTSLHPGYLTVVTGIPGFGKSEFVDQLMLQVSIDHGLRGAYFSPENWPLAIHSVKLIEKLIGKSRRDINTESKEFSTAHGWLDQNIYYTRPKEGYTLDDVLGLLRQCVKRYGIRWYVIDPWNRLDHQFDNRIMTATQYISQCLDKITNFNHVNGTHGVIVAHPAKMKRGKDGEWEVPGLYDISDSAHWANKGDIGITIHKINKPDEKPRSKVLVTKSKFKYWGTGVGAVEYDWDAYSGRYSEGTLDRHHWLMEKAPEEPAPWFGHKDP